MPSSLTATSRLASNSQAGCHPTSAKRTWLSKRHRAGCQTAASQTGATISLRSGAPMSSRSPTDTFKLRLSAGPGCGTTSPRLPTGTVETLWCASRSRGCSTLAMGTDLITASLPCSVPSTRPSATRNWPLSRGNGYAGAPWATVPLRFRLPSYRCVLTTHNPCPKGNSVTSSPGFIGTSSLRAAPSLDVSRTTQSGWTGRYCERQSWNDAHTQRFSNQLKPLRMRRSPRPSGKEQQPAAESRPNPAQEWRTSRLTPVRRSQHPLTVRHEADGRLLPVHLTSTLIKSPLQKALKTNA
jgi:hypothetical protein